MAALTFNAATVAPQDAFDTLPAGWYNVRMTASENKPTKDGQGSYLALTLTVMDGPAVGRKIFDRLNLNNKNPKAVEIAYQTLSSINAMQLGAILELNNAGQYAEGNETAGYKKIEGGGGAPAAPAWVQPAPIPAAPVAQPWAQQPQPAHTAPVQQPVAPAQPAVASPPWATQ